MPLQEALFKARQKGLDLVEVAPKAQPPVCKIIDFKKFRYQEDKKLRASKRGQRQDLKEFRFTPFIAPRDYEIRINRAREFLNKGRKVRLTVKFLGRQITRKKFGYELLNKAVEALRDISKIEAEAKLQGKLLCTVLAPSKKLLANTETKENDKTKNKKISPKKV